MASVPACGPWSAAIAEARQQAAAGKAAVRTGPGVFTIKSGKPPAQSHHRAPVFTITVRDLASLSVTCTCKAQAPCWHSASALLVGIAQQAIARRKRHSISAQDQATLDALAASWQ